ncbi:hypothetical protein ABZ714_09380 [Streptomyces sp. NPDC006798]|uniref:hypothetical protein n=1 Tax=Streptomyces sp. NPDC006798 TaxID=3155462 RepID=UPI0033E4892C
MRQQVQPQAPVSATAAATGAVARRRWTARTALVGALLAPALLAGGPASAGVTGPWSTPTSLSATAADGVSVVDVRTTGTGDVVAVSYRETPGSGRMDLQIAIRPANSAVWGAPVVVDNLPTGLESVELVPGPDGSLTLTWINRAATNTIRTAVLAPGATAFSAPVDIATGVNYIDASTAVGTGGKAVVSWSRYENRATAVYVAERAGTGAAWSAPVKLDNTPAETLEGGPDTLLGPDGTATVVWTENRADGRTVRAVDRTAGAPAWTVPRALSAATVDAGGADATLAADGSAVISWLSSPTGTWTNETLDVAVRPAGSTQWGAAQQATPVEYTGAGGVGPLVAPNGEITLVWHGYRDNAFGLHSVTRSPATGAWSAPQLLSTGYPREEFDAETGPDGTVHVLWSQQAPSGSPQTVHYAGRTAGGSWTTAQTLSTEPSEVAQGQVVGGPESRTTAVWQQTTAVGGVGRLWSAGTGLTP